MNPSKYTIVTTTLTRPNNVNYISQTVENLQRANVFKSPLFGGFFIFHTDFPFYHNLNDNALRALKAAYDNNTDWIIYLEDDVDFISNFLESVDDWIYQHRDDDVLVYPLGASYAEVSETDKSVWEYPVRAFYGVQAYCIHRSKLELLIPYFEENNKIGGKRTVHDILLQEWAISRNATHFLTPCPSFVQHIGYISSVHPGKFHSFESWPGRDYVYKSEKIR